MEIWELGAARQAAAIRSRELSSREVVAAHVERIEAVNPAVGADLDDLPAVIASMRMVVPVNLLGLPSAAVPAGPGPGGVQLIGPRFGEALCLEAAAAVEAALGAPVPIDPRSAAAAPARGPC